MTVICAVRDPAGHVLIGSDTLACNGDSRAYLTGDTAKWAIGRRWAFGLSGHLRFLQLAQRSLGKLDEAEDEVAAALSLRELIRCDGAEGYDDKGAPLAFDLSFLLTDGSRLWSGCAQFALVEMPAYAASGSGREFATGAMHAAAAVNEPPGHVLQAGLAAAIEHCRDVGVAPGKPPFWCAFSGPGATA